MRSRRLLIIITSASILLYGFIFAFLGINLFSVEENYQKQELIYAEEIKVALGKALNAPEPMAALETLIENYALEVMVYDGEQRIYESIHLAPGQNRQDVLNEGAVFLEAAGEVTLDNGRVVNVWYVIYHMPFIDYLGSFLSFQNVLLMVAFFIILALVMVLQYFLLKPLYGIKDSIEKLEKYEFEAIEEGEDDINKRMAVFSHQLDHAIRSVQRKNTQLELSLQRERERLSNVIQLSRVLVHDLKSPVYQLLLENESRIEQLEDKEKGIRDLGTYNINQSDKLLHSINDILKLLKEGNYGLNKEQETFDFMAMIFETLKLFKPGMVKKDLSFYVDGPDVLTVYLNKITMRLLLHNIFSNMVQYASEGTELSIEVVMEKDNIYLKAVNESSLENIEGMKKSEQLFNVMDQKETGDHLYSSGNGLFLIKDLIFLIGGKYGYAVQGNQVILSLHIPVEKGMEE